MFKAIVAVDKNWGIGKDNSLLISIPEDMKFFRSTTMGAVVIMGRKTLESFPGGKPLKNRDNVIITNNQDYAPEGVSVIHDIEKLPQQIEEMFPEKTAEGHVFVIGGASIYRQLLKFCDTVYVTKIDKEFEADAFYPDLDADPEWKITECSDDKKWEDLTFRFVTYKRI